MKYGFNENDLQEMTSTFNRLFVQKENFLCVINETTNKDFFIIFPHEAVCDKVTNAIKSVKFPNALFPAKDSVMEDTLFKKKFYVPIIKEIQADSQKYGDLQSLVLKLVDSFDAGTRQSYMNMVFETLIGTPSTSNNGKGQQHDTRIASNNEKSLLSTSSKTNDNSYGGNGKDIILNGTRKSYSLRTRSVNSNDTFETSNYELLNYTQAKASKGKGKRFLFLVLLLLCDFIGKMEEISILHFNAK
uniref:Uncharacterized protein n=1 Tax=Panagrolaimus sp. ES5 TaxID=591445 RepID=A0AC34GXF1_9BILA